MSRLQKPLQDHGFVVDVAFDMADQGRFNLCSKQRDLDSQIPIDVTLSSRRVAAQRNSSRRTEQRFGLIGNESQVSRRSTHIPSSFLHPRHRVWINKSGSLSWQVIQQLESNHGQRVIRFGSNLQQLRQHRQRLRCQQLPKSLIGQRCNNPFRFGWQMMLKAEFHVLSLVLKNCRGGSYATSY